MKNIRLTVSFTKSPKNKVTALNFVRMPVAGDLVETEHGGYRVKAIVHKVGVGLNDDATVSVLLEPVASFVK
jgi:hypothetical protein